MPEIVFPNIAVWAMADEHTERTNTELIKRCRQGDAVAWQQLVDRYSRLVLGSCVRQGLSQTEAEDVAQEVFLALAQSLAALDDPERLPGWLLTTARRLVWRQVQKRRRDGPLQHADITDAEPVTPLRPLFGRMLSMDELLAGWSAQEVLAQGMQRMDARCQKLLTLLFLDSDEPSYDVIASQLGLPKGSIGPTRNRCLQQLRTILERLEAGG